MELQDDFEAFNKTVSPWRVPFARTRTGVGTEFATDLGQDLATQKTL